MAKYSGGLGYLTQEEREYYRNLGKQKWDNEQARKKAEEERKKAEKEAEKAAEEAEKLRRLEEVRENLIREDEEDEKKDGLLSRLIGGTGDLAKSGVDSLKGLDLSRNEMEGGPLAKFAKGFTRGTANILDGIDPATWLLGNEQGFASKLGQRYGGDFLQDALRPAESEGQRALDMVGQIGGSLNPFGAAYKGTQKATSLATKALTPDMSDLARQATAKPQTISETAGTGAIAGGLFNQAGNVSAGFQGDERSLGEKLGHSALEIGLGAVGDVAVRGAGSLVKRLASKGNAPEQPVKEAIELRNTEPIKNPVDYDPDIPKQTFTTLDDVMDSVPKPEPVYTTAKDAQKGVTYAQKLGDKFLEFQKKFQDKNQGVRVIERKDRKLRGDKKAYGNERVYQSLTVEQGAVPAAMDYVNQRIVPIFEEVRKLKGVAKEAFDPNKDVLEYALAKRGQDMVDRLGREAGTSLPKGMTPEWIADTLARGEGSVTQQAHTQLMELMDDLMVMVRDSGYLSDQQYQTMRLEHPNYFPFSRDKEYSDEAFIKAFDGVLHGKKGIRSLGEGSGEPIKDPIQQLINHVTGMHRLAAKQQTHNEIHALAKQGSELVKVLKKGESGNNVIDARIDGKNVRLDVHPEIKEAVDRPLNEVERNLMMKVAGVQRASIVMMPHFLVKEPFRSLPFAYVTSRAGMKVGDIGNALVDIVANARGNRPKSYDDFIRNGGGMTSILAQDIDARNAAYKAIEQGKSLSGFKAASNPSQYLNMIRRFSEQMEQLPKYAEFLATKRKGGDNLQATFNAREIYDHRISGSTVEKANKYVSFLNSNIRGKDKLYRAFRENPIRTTIRSLMVTGPPVALAHVSYHHFASDEQKRRIDEAPLELKELYTLIPMPNSDEIWRIPKPFEAHLIAGKPLEILLDSLKDESYEWDTKEQVMAFMSQNLFHNPSLNPVTPLYETVLNRDSFTGREIVDRFDDRPKGEQFEPTTALMSILLANMVNSVPTFENVISPKQVDHLINGYMPSFGQVANRVIDRSFKENLPNERALSINPFESAFTYQSNYSPTVGDFYETRDDLNQERREQEDDFLFEESRSQVFRPIEEQLTELRNLRKDILEDSSLSPAQKQRAIDRLDAERNQLTRDLHDQGLTGANNRTNMTILEQALMQ